MYNERTISTPNTQGSTGPQINKCAETTVLESAIGQLASNNGAIVALTERVNIVCDRLIGPDQQEGMARDGSMNPAPGLCYDIRDRLQAQEFYIGQLEIAIRRLSVV